jgi:intraflagellar transport protein 140
MAKLCVKTKRIDVMEICLRNIGHLRGLMALREARREPEVEAQVALVGVLIG